jgi:dTDP-4-amino-4,6-dideoxygalactose transaminase
MIPFIDLKTQFAGIEAEVRRRMDAVLAHGNFIMGPEVAELEAALCRYVGVKHCVSCSSGTDALLMGLMAKDVGPGDAVFTTPFTFIATAEVIALLGATPVYVDIDPATCNIDPARLALAVEAVVSGDASGHPLPRTPGKLTPKGVIPVDLFGLPADCDAINAIARDHGMFVLEDAAQGFGGGYKGKVACSLCEMGATSFFPAKPLGCYGDGGAVFTDDDQIAEALRSIRVHGKGTHKYDNARVGINGRLDTLQAAILLAKLAVFPAELEARQHVAAAYSEGLSGIAGLTVPYVPQGYKSAWAQYSILSDAKPAIMAGLKEAGIPTAVYYPKPLHLQSAFAGLGYAPGDMPASEAAAQRIFSLPMHPYLDADTVKRICAIVASLDVCAT